MRLSGCPSSPSCQVSLDYLHDNDGGGLNAFPFYRGDLREKYLQLVQEGLWHPVEYHFFKIFKIKEKIRKRDEERERCFGFFLKPSCGCMSVYNY